MEGGFIALIPNGSQGYLGEKDKQTGLETVANFLSIYYVPGDIKQLVSKPQDNPVRLVLIYR